MAIKSRSKAVVKIEVDRKHKGEYKASPCTFVHRGDTVTFENHTRKTVQMQFANGTLFYLDDLELPARTKARLTVSPCARAGEYPFAVYCQQGMKFARGGSMPIIIVEPKT